jgi:hypothetical protein
MESSLIMDTSAVNLAYFSGRTVESGVYSGSASTGYMLVMLLLQGERGLQTGRYRGMLSTGWGIAREEGVTALWKGKYCTITLFFSFCFLPHSVANPYPGSDAFLTPGSGIRDG